VRARLDQEVHDTEGVANITQILLFTSSSILSRSLTNGCEMSSYSIFAYLALTFTQSLHCTWLHCSHQRQCLCVKIASPFEMVVQFYSRSMSI
jgi:hypothetical protein